MIAGFIEKLENTDICRLFRLYFIHHSFYGLK